MITGSGAAEDVVRQVVLALDAGVDRVQIRRKSSSAREVETLVVAVLRARGDSRRRILVNDRLDIAMAHQLGGVHLPADGFRPNVVRKAAPPDFEIGVSTHTAEGARRAAMDGADFVVYGPVFRTKSKPGHPGQGLERLREVVSSVPIPVYAIGGITPSRLPEVATTAAAGVAAISVFESERSLQELFQCLP